MTSISSRTAVPKVVTPTFDEIVRLIDGVCGSHLTDEYAMVARQVDERGGCEYAVRDQIAAEAVQT